ncbi:hypothetical protein [Microbacterium sp. AR7-10]|uniref:hypothetical protein n=1 Tax=Microbacterium sp. AR7-10 TaxID=1891970 RepID=UPI0008FC2537|nr:hypothetical protein [Microbacterium sp. AR7-10]OIU84620.1 hypothetical protein BFN01_02200 [Microbacterium sp. AR7-10]
MTTITRHLLAVEPDAVTTHIEAGQQRLIRLRRRALIAECRRYATRARRARLRGLLADIRSIGHQLDALDPTAPEATDVIKAATRLMDSIHRDLELCGA